MREFLREKLETEANTGNEDSTSVRILRIVNNLILENKMFAELNEAELTESLSFLIENPPLELWYIPDDELTKRIEKVLLVELMFNAARELSPEQMDVFEASSKRRKLF